MTINTKQILVSAEQSDFKKQIQSLRQLLLEAARFGLDTEEYKTVVKIIQKVANNGDDAIVEYTKKFDDPEFSKDKIKITPQQLKQAHDQIEPSLLISLKQAIENVRKYQSEIFVGSKISHPGIKYTPISRVGIWIPGASAPLPSTVIMTAVPAQVAGVSKIVVVSPPRHNGSIHPVIMALCWELGIREVYTAGGVPAIAALASEKGTIPQVDKIVGPGNQWVQTAKKLVLGYVGIDSIAGPSEVLIIANDNANPKWVAADMLSQAEHAPGSAILATDSSNLAKQVIASLGEQLSKLSRRKDTLTCLEKFSKVIIFKNIDQAVDFANDFASEHLQIQCGEQSKDIAAKIQNAGAIFIGSYTPVAVGDYWAGPSHTLPTGMSAKFFSPLSSNDFVKSTSIIEYSKEMLIASAEHIQKLALTEGLDAHAKSVKIRTEK